MAPHFRSALSLGQRTVSGEDDAGMRELNQMDRSPALIKLARFYSYIQVRFRDRGAVAKLIKLA